MSPPIDSALARSLGNGTLLLDCPTIVLTQKKSKQPRVLSGPGHLSSTARDRLSLRMYPAGQSVQDGWQILSEELALVEPGGTIPPEGFYELAATDMQGNHWFNPRVKIDAHSSPVGMVVSAPIDALHLIEPLQDPNVHVLRLFIFQDINVAFNVSTDTQVTARGEPLRRHLSFNRAEFSVGSLSFKLEKADDEGGATVITVNSPSTLPPAIEWRIQEALRFVTLTDTSWAISERLDDSKCAITVIAPRTIQSCLLPPPVREGDASFWPLFGAYLSHVCKYSDPESFHPLSAHIHALVSAGGNQIDVVGLLLGIAVEGVLNTEFSEIVKVPQDQKDWIDTVLSTVRGIADLPARLCARVQGAVSAMKSPRAKDKLRALIEANVIEQRHVRAWEALRNSSAHAVHFDAKDIQDHLARCYTVYELLLLLIHHTIKFDEPYRSFGISGWPLVTRPSIRAEGGV